MAFFGRLTQGTKVVCGIFGYLAPPGVFSRELLEKGLELAAHRGPDGYGYLLADSAAGKGAFFRALPERLPYSDVALAHRRLAILDVSEAGTQPMSGAEGRVWITYNGEIYNYIELRTELEQKGFRFETGTDTEVVLNAYVHWGADCVSRFNGIWAFAILDLRQRSLFCSRDRFGVKPFNYIFEKDGKFVFGSELKQLLPFVQPQVNEQAVYEFLTAGSFDHSADTFFKGVCRLSPGHNLTIDLSTGTRKLVKYYMPVIELDADISPASAAHQFETLLSDSVRLQLRSDVSVGSCLSGGLDSTALVCLARDLIVAAGGCVEQHAFSSHFDDPEANEREYMDAAIAASGVVSHIIEPTSDELMKDLGKLVWHQDEPFGSTSIFAQWRVYEAVHQAGIKVMLDGQGADEQLGGYLSFASLYFAELAAKGEWLRLLRETRRFAQNQNTSWRGSLPLPGWLKGSRASDLAQFNWLRPEFGERHAADSEYSRFIQSGPFGAEEKLNNLCYAMVFHNNIPALLRYEDRNSMAWSVEARVPFLDHRLVEFVLSLPSSLKIRKREYQMGPARRSSWNIARKDSHTIEQVGVCYTRIHMASNCTQTYYTSGA